MVIGGSIAGVATYAIGKHEPFLERYVPKLDNLIAVPSAAAAPPRQSVIRIYRAPHPQFTTHPIRGFLVAGRNCNCDAPPSVYRFPAPLPRPLSALYRAIYLR